jgi:serine/threonine-protein kinase
MATVYLAQDLKNHRPVALKVLRPELAAALGPERFLREVRITARLNHPHILALLDSGGARGFLYYSMPYVAGESLRDRLNREKQLPLDDALQIAREVADALSYAHSHDVVHRDIKPENILLESRHAVVADFGIARAITAAGGDRLTETGIAVGTPAYMSPEQAAGSTDLDGRSDLYSLGCVLYEMLAGRPPFVGATLESVVHQQLTAEPPSVTSIRPAVPGWVAAALSRALAKTPADRFNPVALFGEAIMPRTSVAVAPEPSAQVAVPPRRSSWRRWGLIGGGILVVLVSAIVLGRSLRPKAEGPRHPRTAVAVLPFKNLSPEGPHSYFAEGLHDELVTQLTKVAALTVIGRTSLRTYEGSTKRLSEIGDELAVGSVIEASVQVDGDRLRVTVQLIDPVTEAHQWDERYDETLDDAFAVQSDIAQRIVAAVGATLTGTERTAIAEEPTANAAAYRLYLQGLEYSGPGTITRRKLEIAQAFLEGAVALDSTFALAHAALSIVHGEMFWWRWDPSLERLARQLAEAQIALRLAPHLPQTHIAMGYVYYRARQDYQATLKEFRVALEGLPNDAVVWARIGAVQRRIGNWDEALRAFGKEVALDPRSAAALSQLATTFSHLRRYQEAVDWYNRSLALAPDRAQADLERGLTWVRWKGELDSLGALLDRHPPNTDLGAFGSISAMQALRWLYARRPDSLLALLRRTAQPAFESTEFYLPTALYAAWGHQLRGDRAAARVAFDSARSLLDSTVAVLPDDWRVHAARGLALAGVGQRREAEGEARWLQQSRLYRDDALEGVFPAEDRARILAGVGDADAALDEIERLLARPSFLSVHTLRLDPRWDPSHNSPRFQALLVKYANPQPVR